MLDAWGGGRWNPSAWAWAQYSSQQPEAVGTTHASASQDAMWRALLDIRAFAVRVDDRFARKEHAEAISGAHQLEILKLVKKISIRDNAWKGFSVLFFSFLFLAAWLLFYLGAENGVDMLDEFLTTRVNKIVTDPETQKNIRSSATLFVDNMPSRFNPWNRFRTWISGEVEEVPELSKAEIVSEDTFLALSIILLLQVNHDFGSTAGELMENLKIIGRKDQEKNLRMLELLQNMGYVETVDSYNKQRGYAKSYWPSKSALLDSASGLFEKKMRKTLAASRKENKATSADDKKA